MLTLGDLLTKLRLRLHDSVDRQWTAAEKRQYLNNGVQRTLVETRSYQDSESITVVAGTHTYDGSPVFNLKAVRLGDNSLDRKKLSSMAVMVENWDTLPQGIPTRCIPTGGNYFRVAPTPNAAAAGIIGTVASTPTAGGAGYVAGDELTLDEGGGDAEVKVLTVDAGGAVVTLELNSSTDSQERTVYVRGTGYTAGAGATTTGGTGAGCTVNISALAKLEVYGPSSVGDLVTGTACTMAITGNLITSATHLLTVGDAIAFATTIGGVTVYKTYYVKSTPTADTFTISATVGGVVFTITANGANAWGNDEIVEISLARREAPLQAAEEEARMARASMPGSLKSAELCRAKWLAECEKIGVDLV